MRISIAQALDWIASKQVLEVAGDWAAVRPGLRPGGWAFQYENPYYPDVDDTAVAALALDRFDRERWRPAIGRAAGPFNMKTRITRMSTTPPPPPWRSTALTASAGAPR